MEPPRWLHHPLIAILAHTSLFGGERNAAHTIIWQSTEKRSAIQRAERAEQQDPENGH